jgi:cation diffusion facilitator family transporter
VCTVTAPINASTSVAAPGERDRRVRFVLLVTLGLNLAVAVSKIVVGYAAQALAVRADGFHSLTDGLNNIVALIGVALASRPPDAEHPYGHRRFELFAASVIGLSLLAMSFDVANDAYHRLTGTAVPPDIDALVFITLIVTLVINVGVTVYESRVATETGSTLLASDATHTRSDVLVTVSVLVASVLVKSGFPMVDLIAAAGIAVFIAIAGVRVLKQTLSSLADAASLDATHVVAVALATDGVLGAHHVRSRGARGHVFLDLHLEIDGRRTLEDAHRITHAAMRALEKALPGVIDITVHTEPVMGDAHAHDRAAHGNISPTSGEVPQGGASTKAAIEKV